MTCSHLRLFLMLLTAGILPAQNTMIRDPLPVPDIPGYRTLKADLHTHTVFSDGDVWPTLRAWEAWRDGLDVVAFTDHADSHPHEPDLKTDLTRPYAMTRSLAEQLGLILIPGIELGYRDTHWNAFFVTDPNALRGKLELAEALRRAKAQGAFVQWNHPCWRQTCEWTPEAASLHSDGLFQGIELINSETVYQKAFSWGQEHGLTFLSGSDIHGMTTTRQRPVTLLFVRTADVAGVREALLARRTAVWGRGEVYGAEEHLRGLWQGAVKIENPELAWKPGTRHPRILVRNTSAIPFRLKVSKVTARGAGGAEHKGFQAWTDELRAESVTPLQIGISKDAPAGWSDIDLDLEVANLHTGPASAAMVRMRFRVNVER